MGHFYFVRHGQTVWNVENKICGVTDSPLTELGREQARKTGQMLRKKIDHGEIHIDEIMTSPLSRAFDTAMEISHVIGVPVRIEPRLVEQNFGRWEGTARDGLEFARAKENFADSYGGGESMMKTAQRIYNLIDDIEREPEKTYLLVAHNGISRMIESYFRDMRNEEFAAFGIKNAEVREYKFEDSFPDYQTDYDLLCRQLKSLMKGVDSDTTILSNASALIYQTLQGINWAGAYISQGMSCCSGHFRASRPVSGSLLEKVCAEQQRQRKRRSLWRMCMNLSVTLPATAIRGLRLCCLSVKRAVYMVFWILTAPSSDGSALQIGKGWSNLLRYWVRDWQRNELSSSGQENHNP